MGQGETLNFLKKTKTYKTVDEIAKGVKTSKNALYNQLKSLIKRKEVEFKYRKKICGNCNSKRKVRMFRYKR